jgi:flavodoxin/NAD-dependent dihydropyrimidine dehydrogenase PreA subunit
MDVTLLYFSKTGNTRKIARSMAAGFMQAGNFVRVISMEEANPADTLECELIGVGSPTYSSRAPTPVLEFISRLPSLSQVSAFVFATCGGAPGRVLFDLASGLHDKGAIVVDDFLSRGEVHHPAPHMKGYSKGRPNVEDEDRAKQFAQRLVECFPTDPSLEGNTRKRERIRLRGRLYSFLGGSINDQRLRMMMPQPQLELERCNRCEWCVSECPVGNMVMDPFPRVGDACIRCYRCLSGCPQGALQVNWKIVDPVLWFLYNPRFISWFGGLKRAEK